MNLQGLKEKIVSNKRLSELLAGTNTTGFLLGFGVCLILGTTVYSFTIKKGTKNKETELKTEINVEEK